MLEAAAHIRAYGPCMFGEIQCALRRQLTREDTPADMKLLTVQVLNRLMQLGALLLYETGDAFEINTEWREPWAQ